MYTIQTNASGTRSMEISEENLQTIEKYALFQHLIDSMKAFGLHQLILLYIQWEKEKNKDEEEI